MKYYLFVDESGDHGMKNINPQFPVLVLCGILVSEGHYPIFKNRINQLKQNIFGTTDIVLHSTEIRKKEGPFSVLNNKDLNNTFINDFNKIVTECSFRIISAAIRKESYRDRYQNPFRGIYETAFSFMLERVVA